MDSEQLISFAESVCGSNMWEEIIPYLKFEKTHNQNLAAENVYQEAIDICELRYTIYLEEV